MSKPKEGDVRVWWIPQVPMSAFEVSVPTVEEGFRVCTILAAYDLFQFEKGVKPDYCNVGGVQIFEDGEWCDTNEEDQAWRREEARETEGE